MTEAFRCSAAAAELEEPLVGTASTVRAFVLVETAGPWGVDAVRDARLPGEVKDHLATLERDHRIRPLLVRRHGRTRPKGPVRVFAAGVREEQPWLETAELGDVRELLDLELTGLAAGRRPGLTPDPGPLFLVCTHGRHDACCAERGRPLCAALSSSAPEHTWEVSHIGGDRFAANLLVLPHGLYYGRLEPGDAAEFARAHLDGELDLAHLRGRSAFPFSVQAAEIYLRRHTGELAVGPLTLVEHSRHGTETRAVFQVGGKDWEVRVHTDVGPARQLTCRAARRSPALVHTLVDLRG
jgi:hypothetical protein